MGAEDLDERNLEGGNLSVQEDTREIKLDLETDVDIGTIDGRRPPQGESTIGNLVETRPLGICKLLELHRLLETARFFPEQTLPRRESRRLEQGMLEDRFHTTQSLNHVCSVRVQIPKFSIVSLARPPEGITLHVLINLELSSRPEALIEAKRAAIFLEQRVDSRKTTIPAIFEILERQSSVLLLGFLSLLGVFHPYTLGVDELALPRDDISEDVGNQGLLVVGHAGTVMRDASVGLLRPTLVACRYEDV